MLWRIYSILETHFKQRVSFPFYYSLYLILETFISDSAQPMLWRIYSILETFQTTQWVSQSNILYSSFRDIHADSAHPMLWRIYLISGNYSNNEWVSHSNINYSNYRDIHSAWSIQFDPILKRDIQLLEITI